MALSLATLVGVGLGLFGGGGSILSVAILSFALGMPPKAAIAASLLITGVTSTAALIAQRGSGLVSVRTGVAFGSAAMVGAFAGSRLTFLLPEAVQLTALGVVMLLTSIAMLLRNPASRDAGSQRTNEKKWVHALRLLALALGVGIVTGLLGAGGGFLIAPALVVHGRMPMKRAVATSLVVIPLQSFAGLVSRPGLASVDWAVVAPFTLMAALGSVVGGALAKRAPQELLRRGYSALLMLVAIVVVMRELPRMVRLSAPYRRPFNSRLHSQGEAMISRIRANFFERVVVLPGAGPWVASPSAGVTRKMLDRIGDEIARATSIVRFLPNAAFPEHVHGGGEEFLVLQGLFVDDEGEYPAGAYVRNPVGSKHAPRAGRDGATLLVKLHQFAAGDVKRVVVHATTRPWLPGSAAGLSVLPLHEFGEEHAALVRWAPHTRFHRHSHWGGEEVFVLDGVFRDEHGEYPAGSWIRSPHLSTHMPFTVSEGATIFVKVGHLGVTKSGTSG